MIELIRTNDAVLISWLVARFDAEGIGHVVLDHHTSNLEGSIGALPRRIMVLAEDESAARRVLDSRPAPDRVNEGDAIEREWAGVGVAPLKPGRGRA